MRRFRSLIIALLVVACGGASTGAPTPTNPVSTTGPTSTAAGQTAPPASTGPRASPTDPTAAYGYGPQPDPSVTYQPDVVMVGGGPSAIRGVDSNGLTWTVDAHAAGVDQLAPGKIMFASSEAVGRVLKVEPKGETTDVTIGPVGVGEVIKDAHLVFDQQVPLDALQIYDVPQPAEGYEDAPSEDLTATPSPTPGARRDGAMALTGALEPSVRRPAYSGVAGGSSYSKSLNGWTFTAYKQAGTIGLRAERGLSGSQENLKVALDAHIDAANLQVSADIPVANGEVGTSHFRITGITGLVISVQAGAVNGLSDNRNLKYEVPIQLSERVIIGGFPATLTQKFKFLVQTAFTAKNGNLTAIGEWDIDGPLGIDGPTISLPTMTSRGGRHLIDTLEGVSIGVNGIVVAISFEFGLIFGLPYAGAGPVASFITSLGMTNGSSLGIVQCKQVSITSTLTAGVGIQVFDPVKTAIQKLLGYTVPGEKNLITKNILQENWVKPDVVACR
jgi:hypothetical protein